MCRFLGKLNLTRKKKSLKASQAGTENNQQERVNYWGKIRDVPPENLIFLDEMGVLLGIMRDYGRSEKGERLYDKKLFYRGARRTVIGGITKDKVIALDIIYKSMNGEDFQQFLKKHLAPVLTDTSVVVMDKLRFSTMAGVKKIIEEKGAKVIYLSGYSPDFNPIEHLWWELKAFLRCFVPKSKEAVDALLRLAVEYLISSEQLSHYLLLLSGLITQSAVINIKHFNPHKHLLYLVLNVSTLIKMTITLPFIGAPIPTSKGVDWKPEKTLSKMQ